jgi:hypothetical protein
VPNGCTDDTANVARIVLADLVARSKLTRVKYAVCEVAEPGKTNAWNRYVHQFSAPHAKYLLLMDADIEFLGDRTVRNTIDELERTPRANVAVDTPTKDIVLKPNKNLIEKLSLSVSAAATNSTEVWICGQFYCGRGEVLRQIWMPPGLLAEDGFLTTIIWTNNLTSAPEIDRIVRTPNAAHTFEALTNPQKLMRHEKRVTIAMTINHYLFEYLDRICDRDRDAGTVIKQMNDRDPAWLKHLFQDVLDRQKWWIIPTAWLFGRFRALKYQSLPRMVLLLPATSVAFLVNLVVFFQANRDMRRGMNIGYW